MNIKAVQTYYKSSVDKQPKSTFSAFDIHYGNILL